MSVESGRLFKRVSDSVFKAFNMVFYFNCTDFLELYYCKTCNWSTNGKTSYQFHNCKGENESEVIRKKFICDECLTYSYSILWIFAHQMKHNHWKPIRCPVKTEFECKKCNFRSHQYSHVKCHITQRHTPDYLIKWYNCNICSYRGKLKGLLKQHMNLMHTPDSQITWFTCSICNFKAKRNNELKKHLEKHIIEQNSQTNICSKCGYQTNSKYNLDRHIMSRHTPDHLISWYNCHICISKTKSRTSITKHLKKTHGIEEQMIWLKCQICNSRYQNESRLKHHKISCHFTGEYCFDCEYKPKDLADLRKHLKCRHSKVEKRFKCEQCQFDTDLKWCLQRHYSAIHT